MSCRTGYSNMSAVVRLDLVYDGLVASHVHLPPQLLGRGGCLTLIAVALDQKPKIMASLHLCLHHLAPFFGHPILTPVFFHKLETGLESAAVSLHAYVGSCATKLSTAFASIR